MSIELLVLTGGPEEEERRRREMLVNHAASKFRGNYNWKIVSRGQVTLALVSSVGSTVSNSIWEIGANHQKMVVGVVGNKDLQSRLSSEAGVEPASWGGENGCILVEVNSQGNRLKIVNDGVGFFPSFYVAEGECFRFSTSLHALVSLGLSPEWDMTGVIEYLATLNPFGGRTLLRSARELPPGSVLTWQNAGRVRLTSDSLLAPCRKSDPEMTAEQLIEQFQQTWHAVMDRLRRRFSGRVGLGLSGGLDSRAIANGLVDRGFYPLSFTYGSTDQDDVRGASLVANRLNLKHLRIPVRDDCKLRDADFALEALDGSHSPFEMYEAWFINDLKAVSDCLINGATGDMFLGSDIGCAIQDAAAAREFILHKYANSLHRILRFLDDKTAGDRFARGLDESLAPYVSGQYDCPTMYWNLANRQRRWGFSLNSVVRRAGFQYENPFFDAEFLGFASRIPVALRAGGRLYLRIHQQLFSKTSDLSCTRMGFAPKQLDDHLYVDVTRIRRQSSFHLGRLINLMPSHPATAGKYSLDVVASYRRGLLRKLGMSRGLGRTHLVFDHGTWLHANGRYRQRYVDLLDRARSDVPDFVVLPELTKVAGELHKVNSNSDVLLIGRLISLCLWHQIWKTRSGEARRVGRERY